MSKQKKHTAPGPMAGYIFQLDRAFIYLALAKSNESVAVEYFDDVSVQTDASRITQEQNKNSVQQVGKEILGDRSVSLWRTLEIWLDSIKGDPENLCCKYVIAINKSVNSPIANLLKLTPHSAASLKELIRALRVVGKPRRSSKTKIQTIIDSVLQRSDGELEMILSRVEVVDGPNVESDIDELANGFGIMPGMDASKVLDSLRGWMQNAFKSEWKAGRPGKVSRRSALLQCRQIERHMARERLLPKPAAEIPVSENDRRNALTRPFVDHLQRISAGEEDIYEAVEHFIQFNVEKYRLAQSGEIPDREWDDRSSRLQQRWTRIARSKRRSLSGLPPQAIGIAILEETTYHHREPICNLDCNEHYMTSGHYHRLADDNYVWWDPNYSAEK